MLSRTDAQATLNGIVEVSDRDAGHVFLQYQDKLINDCIAIKSFSELSRVLWI
jgi:hypothetical protein